MGKGSGLGHFVFILSFLTFTTFWVSSAVARRACAEGVTVFSLPSGEVIPEVEAINTERAGELERYNSRNSVEGQLHQRQVFGYVAVRGESEVLGFAVVERRSNYFQILNIAVAKSAERQGVGTSLVEHILEQASRASGIDEVRTLIAYNDDGARTFFGKVEFSETEVIPQKFERRTRSGVMMKKILRDRAAEAAEAKLQLQPKLEPRRVSVAVQVIDIPMEDLRRIDPTLEHARDYD